MALWIYNDGNVVFLKATKVLRFDLPMGTVAANGYVVPISNNLKTESFFHFFLTKELQFRLISEFGSSFI